MTFYILGTFRLTDCSKNLGFRNNRETIQKIDFPLAVLIPNLYFLNIFEHPKKAFILIKYIF